MFLSSDQVTGNTSGATSTIKDLNLRVGVATTHSFVSSLNNFIYSMIGNTIATITAITTGSGGSFAISPDLLYTETVNVNSDMLLDYIYMDLESINLTGNVSVNTTSANIVGVGTDFVTELRHAVSGNVSVSNSSFIVIGDGTDFTTSIATNDIVQVGADIRRVQTISNDSILTVNAYFTTTNAAATINVTPYIIVSNGSYVESQRIIEIANSTSLIAESTWSSACTDLDITTSWAFPGNSVANTTYGVLDDIFSDVTLTIGSIRSITNINPGSNYTATPIFNIYEPLTASYRKQDVILTISGSSGSFTEGELIYQEDNDSLGKVTYANSTYVEVKRYRFSNSKNFTITSNSTTILIGNTSGVTANITSIANNTSTKYLGYNANVYSSITSSTGSILEVEVINSGIGYNKNEEITLTGSQGNTTGVATLGKYGKGTGYYKEKGGFVSDQKKLFDGLYYQEYSYEIRSSVPLYKYEDMLKQLLHVAGTKYFGGYVFTSDVEAFNSVESTIITQE